MPELMRAASYLGPGRLEVGEAPVPVAGPGEVVVRVRAALTCGTEVKMYRRGHPKFPPPFVLGHEFGGEVVELGAGVSAFGVGQRVTANVFAECGECFYCRRGQGNLCERLVYNFGAFAEYLRVPAAIVARTLFAIPPHLSEAEAAVVEPLTCVVHAHRLAGLQPGESVAVVGAGGPIGLLFIQLARHTGAGPIIAVGRRPERLAMAAHLGASHCLSAEQGDVVGAVRDLTGGHGADVVFECAGAQATWEAAVLAVRKGGRVVWFGGLPAGTLVPVDAARVHYGEIALLGSHGGTAAEARAALQLLAERTVDARPLLSGERPLAQVEQALQAVMAGQAIKLIIRPDR